MPTFIANDALGSQEIYAIIIKCGAINPSRANELEKILSQVSSAFKEKFIYTNSRHVRRPTKILICATGKISEKARQRFFEENHDVRTIIWDANDLIPRIDANIPEFWNGVDTEAAPYFRKLRASLEDASDDLGMPDLLPGGTFPSAVTDQMFVPLKLFRTTVRLQNRNGTITKVPNIEQLPLTGIVRKPDRLVLVLGGAGSGKSTSLKRIAYILAEQNLGEGGKNKLPVLLRAIDICNISLNLKAIANNAITNLISSESSAIFETALSAGTVSVLIDSLDELPEDSSRAEVVTKILEFSKSYPKCQVIITSRPLEFLETPQITSVFSTYNLVSIDFKQAEKIVTRIQRKKSLPTAQTKELLRRIQQVHGFELNPLLVTVFAATSEADRKDIPANITELFKKYTEMMLGRWDATKGLGQQYHAPLKDFLLRKAAYEMHSRRITSIPIADFASFVKAELTSRGHQTDADQLLDEITVRSGLFRNIGGNIEFRHFFLQEFFAGRGIPSTNHIKEFISDAWWQRSIVFYFGENPGDSSGLFNLVQSLPELDPKKVYAASIALGLSLQASYLVETKQVPRRL